MGNRQKDKVTSVLQPARTIAETSYISGDMAIESGAPLSAIGKPCSHQEGKDKSDF